MKDKRLTTNKVNIRDVNAIYNIYSDNGVLKNQNVYPMNKKIQAYIFFIRKYKKLYNIRMENETVGFIEMKNMKFFTR